MVVDALASRLDVSPLQKHPTSLGWAYGSEFRPHIFLVACLAAALVARQGQAATKDVSEILKGVVTQGELAS
jgi:hypothetical protein